jgi:hypothetical protein
MDGDFVENNPVNALVLVFIAGLRRINTRSIEVNLSIRYLTSDYEKKFNK